MNEPIIDIIVPLKWKPLVGLVGSMLTFIIPTLLTVSTNLPSPWPLVIAAGVAVLTYLGIYQAPYKPQGTILVSANEIQQLAKADDSQSVQPDEYTDPWP